MRRRIFGQSPINEGAHRLHLGRHSKRPQVLDVIGRDGVLRRQVRGAEGTHRPGAASGRHRRGAARLIGDQRQGVNVLLNLERGSKKALLLKQTKAADAAGKSRRLVDGGRQARQREGVVVENRSVHVQNLLDG
jgi:hypothetical protein